MKETVLVTGGAGYIGSHTAVELIQAGFDVVIADNLSNSDLQAVEGVRRITGAEVPFEQIDCCDLQAMRRLFERHEFRSVIHFAASKAVGESVAEPLKYYRNNLLSFLNVVELMCDFGRPNILFSSSCTVYGEPDAQPVTEQTPRKPATSPYGNTKQISEDILRDAVAAHPGLRGIALRYFNPIGSHPSALIGELPRGVPQNLVPYVTQTAAGIRECLSIFGNDYPTPDGTCIRDYIDIVDLARAHVAALHRLIEERGATPYEVFNVGTGRGVSVLELVRGFERANGLKLNYRFAPRRAGDITAIWADPTLANTLLGWRAERPLEERSARPGNGSCTSDRDNLPADRTYCGERIRSRSGCALRILLPPVPTSGPDWSFAPNRPPPLHLQRLFSSFSQQKGEAIDIFCIFASIGKIMNLKCRNCMKRR